MSTYNQLIHEYRLKFKEKGLPPELVKAFIFELCNEFGINLYLEIDNQVDKELYEKFEKGIIRLLDGEPLNYVLGYSYFYGYRFIVNPDVLIPRPETEELVGLILSQYDEYFKGEKIKVCDIGTGSGAIAIALKKEEDNLDVYASDISAVALNVAKANASNNQCEITFLEGSMLEPYIEKGLKFDILVSNPPYIRSVEKVEASVYDYEPHVALFGGEDGLKFYREIFENAAKILNDKALAFFEMGYDQKENLSKLAREYFDDVDIRVYKDINGKDRMLMLKFF
ncbi:MAG: peptide chain release factor N(5)-glutamine methyltransferase [Erysipelotrichaceae bacterium]|nr:peptide chain release factor N(5)-glutamine methyltransferase [Erysipelotrichaceae bacterium]MBR4484730.1 peptide chain release factor N(5)-glutamine methyltransferase [Erysipelotrichaceae bacterium]